MLFSCWLDNVERLEVVILEVLGPVHFPLPFIRVESGALLNLAFLRKDSSEEATTERVVCIETHTIMP